MYASSAILHNISRYGELAKIIEDILSATGDLSAAQLNSSVNYLAQITMKAGVRCRRNLEPSEQANLFLQFLYICWE